MKRIAPDAGPDGPDADPYSPDGLRQAQEDREEIMDLFGWDEGDFPEETIWLPDEDDDVPPVD